MESTHTTIQPPRIPPSQPPPILKTRTPEELLDEIGFKYTMITSSAGERLYLLLASPLGKTLRKPIQITLPATMNTRDFDLYGYMIRGIYLKGPRLLPEALACAAIRQLARHLKRWRTGSLHTIGNYVYGLLRFCEWIGKTPDQLIQESLDSEEVPIPRAVKQAALLLEEWVSELQANKLTPNLIANYIKPVKLLYKVHGVNLALPFPLVRRVVYKDRAPTPEELTRLMDIADIRGKVLVSCLPLGGFRPGTLAQLQYRHVKEDLEKGIIPIHIHVEAEITKGKYGDYDTFLAQEAIDALKVYLDVRRRGTRYIPPEVITDSSPLIRNAHNSNVTPITEAQIYSLIHSLYLKGGLLDGQRLGRRYRLWAHTLRKYFRTQLASLGVDRDYIEYMMGHKISTYHDIQMKGVEYLRNIYAASNLSIRPKTKVNLIDTLKTIIRSAGKNPEEYLTREAMIEPHRSYANSRTREDTQIHSLSRLLRELIQEETHAANNETQNGTN